MKRENVLLIGIVISILILPFTASAQFSVQSEIRPRFEFRDGVKTLLNKNQSPAFLTSQRSRIIFSYSNDGIETVLSVQDVRVWGDEVTKNDQAGLMVHQAYAGYSFNQHFSFRLGRQELAYDNIRLIGPSNWNNVATSHDIALLIYKQAHATVHLAMAYNNDKEKNYGTDYPLKNYKYMGYIWANHAWPNRLSVSALTIMDGNQDLNSANLVHRRFTTGIYSKWDNPSGDFGLDGAGYYQYGHNPEGLPLNAFYLSFSPYFKPVQALELLLGWEYFSGDNTLSDNGVSNTFSNLFGDGHGPYGHMDYFTDIPKHTLNSGLMDLYIKAAYMFNKKTSLECTAHHFSMTGSLLDSISTPGVYDVAEKKLGTEIDFMARYKLHPSVELRAGYSVMMATRSMEILKGGDSEKHQQWGWLMVTFKPTLFKQE